MRLIRPHRDGGFASANADVLQMADARGLLATGAPRSSVRDFVNREGMDALPVSVGRFVDLADADDFVAELLAQDVDAEIGKKMMLHRAAARRRIATGPHQLV